MHSFSEDAPTRSLLRSIQGPRLTSASCLSQRSSACDGAVHARRSFYDKDAPIYTMSRFLPPSKVQDAEVSNSVLGDGCVIRAGTTISHSVIGLRSLIGERCRVRPCAIT